ncbi:cyclodeaminase/cyclohydrolase family protein [Leifsonia sp. 71-9]|uniref:cyclodeaminase/cyclohydrolase family protein n=1 Tax=Leifsonia sp. 71-9 TaxID=1895934 RepID=UPI000A9EA6F8|nr:cyclodeaminase/cyclohydrolase family protein [Leifsonia sp. 71-9]
MQEGLWALPTSELLSRTSSSEPTPGGGSIAAITGALGVGLVQMALAVTADPELGPLSGRLDAIRERIVPGADADVADFENLMAAYRAPRSTDTEREERRRLIEAATVAATERPLELVAALIDALVASHDAESAVKPGIVSDVIAGRDIVVGAAWAAIRTVDVNIAQLDRSSSVRAPELRATRDELAHRLQEAS